jgi:hypothetical protein
MTIHSFWKWFEKNSARLRGCDGATVADELESMVSQIDGRLGVEVANIHGKNEFIITANSDPDAFPVARTLAAAAPPVKGWKFICLKPPRGCNFKLQVEGFDVQADHCMFDPLESDELPDSLGIRLFIPSIDDQSIDLEYPATLIVETIIGEELTARISYIDVGLWRDRGDALPISELHKYVKWFFGRRLKQKRDARG